jgi:hypothetical protein
MPVTLHSSGQGKNIKIKIFFSIKERLNNRKKERHSAAQSAAVAAGRGGTDLFNGTFIFLASCKTEFMKQFVRKKTGRITRQLSIIELCVCEGARQSSHQSPPPPPAINMAAFTRTPAACPA